MSVFPVDTQERRALYAALLTEGGIEVQLVIDRLNALIDRTIHWAFEEVGLLESAGVLDRAAMIALEASHPAHSFIVLTDGRCWSRPCGPTSHFRPYEGGKPSKNCGCGRTACTA